MAIYLQDETIVVAVWLMYLETVTYTVIFLMDEFSWLYKLLRRALSFSSLAIAINVMVWRRSAAAKAKVSRSSVTYSWGNSFRFTKIHVVPIALWFPPTHTRAHRLHRSCNYDVINSCYRERINLHKTSWRIIQTNKYARDANTCRAQS